MNSKLLCLRLVLIVLALGTACGKGRREPGARTEAPSLESLEAGVGYPRGTWRINPASVNQVRFAIAHILIGHDKAEPSRSGPFLSDSHARSRADALRLASDLSDRLAVSPTQFAKLAEQHSDDRATRHFGGVMGVVDAHSYPPTVLDALAVLKQGEVSHVIESRFGFHLVKRLPVPAEQRVASRRIVIQHRDVQAQYQSASRTREEALCLANEVAAQARSQPARFPALVHEYSEDPGAPEDGDAGLQSTHEFGERGLANHLLTLVAVGQVVGPVETRFGYEILQRTDSGPRERFGAKYIEIAFDRASRAPDSPFVGRSHEQAEKLAQRLALELAKHPERFDARQRQYGGEADRTTQVLAWQRGSLSPAHDRAVSNLSIGSVAPTPVEQGFAFQVLQRLDASKLDWADSRYLYELPKLEFTPFDSALSRMDSESLAAGTRELMQAAAPVLKLVPDREARFRALFEELAHGFEQAPSSERAALIQATRTQLAMVLDPRQAQQLQQMREARWRALQLAL